MLWCSMHCFQHASGLANRPSWLLLQFSIGTILYWLYWLHQTGLLETSNKHFSTSLPVLTVRYKPTHTFTSCHLVYWCDSTDGILHFVFLTSVAFFHKIMYSRMIPKSHSLSPTSTDNSSIIIHVIFCIKVISSNMHNTTFSYIK